MQVEALLARAKKELEETIQDRPAKVILILRTDHADHLYLAHPADPLKLAKTYLLSHTHIFQPEGECAQAANRDA
jgi:hypothetical protein